MQDVEMGNHILNVFFFLSEMSCMFFSVQFLLYCPLLEYKDFGRTVVSIARVSDLIRGHSKFYKENYQCAMIRDVKRVVVMVK